eukprot:TRINITY_DN3086_c0_g1_i1.p1 TRINITY_DN3086_c0_g1~~TRINITY_DN3086_c0_g1_i1.p1  ORF type:complete len:896 (-),score=164.83 TRINITY_DN3086_c0_g1_i1:510-3197(-)
MTTHDSSPVTNVQFDAADNENQAGTLHDIVDPSTGSVVAAVRCSDTDFTDLSSSGVLPNLVSLIGTIIENKHSVDKQQTQPQGQDQTRDAASDGPERLKKALETLLSSVSRSTGVQVAHVTTVPPGGNSVPPSVRAGLARVASAAHLKLSTKPQAPGGEPDLGIGSPVASSPAGGGASFDKPGFETSHAAPGQPISAMFPGASADGDDRPPAVRGVQSNAVLLDEYLTTLKSDVAKAKALVTTSTFVPDAPIVLRPDALCGPPGSGWRADNTARAEGEKIWTACRAVLGDPDAISNCAASALFDTVRRVFSARDLRQQVNDFDASRGTPGRCARVLAALERRWAATQAAWAGAERECDAVTAQAGVVARVAYALKVLEYREFLLRVVRPQVCALSDVIALATKASRSQAVSLADPTDPRTFIVEVAPSPRSVIFQSVLVRLRVVVTSSYPTVPPTITVVGNDFVTPVVGLEHPNIEKATGEVRIVGRWQWPSRPNATVSKAISMAVMYLEQPDTVGANNDRKTLANAEMAEMWADSSTKKDAIARAHASARQLPDPTTASVSVDALKTQLPSLLLHYAKGLTVKKGAIKNAAAKIHRLEAALARVGRLVDNVDFSYEAAAHAPSRAMPPARPTAATAATGAADASAGGEDSAAITGGSRAKHPPASQSSLQLQTGRIKATKSLLEMRNQRRSATFATILPADMQTGALAAAAQRTPGLAQFLQQQVLGGVRSSSVVQDPEDPRSPSPNVYRHPPRAGTTVAMSAAAAFQTLSDTRYATGGAPRAVRPSGGSGTAQQRLDALKSQPPVSGRLADAGDKLVHDILLWLPAADRIRVGRVCRTWHTASAAPAVRLEAMTSHGMRLVYRHALEVRALALASSRINSLTAAAKRYGVSEE